MKPFDLEKAVQIEDKLPNGWVLYSVDASVQANSPGTALTVLLRRDAAGLEKWLKLPDDLRDHYMLYSGGAGMTVIDALENAISKIDMEVIK